MRGTFALLFLIAISSTSISAASLFGHRTQTTLPPIPMPSPSPSPSETPPRKVSDLTATAFKNGAERQAGLFTLWRRNGNVYLELRPEQLKHEYLEEIVPANGLGGFGLHAGQVFPGEVGGQEARIVRFEQAGPAIAMVWPDNRFVAQEDTPLAAAVKASTADSVETMLPIAVHEKDGGLIVDLKPLLGDLLGLGNELSESVRNPFNPLGAYHLDPERTSFGPSKAFPKNVLIEAEQSFASLNPDTIDTVIDPHFVRIGVKYNLADLPTDPSYVPRLVDDRIGFWSDPHLRFDHPELYDNRLEYAVRWDVRASDPSKPISPAEHPIIYTIGKTVPVEYRQAIRDGLLEWNKAFEQIGISDAIEVQDQPDDPNFDPDDLRYNVVRWVTDAHSGFGAEAQPVWDPRTGEIFRGGILLDSNLVRYGAFARYDFLLTPTSNPNTIVPLTPARRSANGLEDEAAYGRGAHEQFFFGGLALALMNGHNLRTPPPEFVHDYLKMVVLHEVGHNFGLGHNFIAHHAFTTAELQSKIFTRFNGITSSVMEYAPINLWPKGTPQGEYFQTTLGPYDYFAIRWGYAPILGAKSSDDELPTLHRWASEANQPRYLFAGDEDAQWDGHAVDPRVQQFMLSNDEIGWCATRADLASSLLRTLDRRFPAEQEPWEIERQAFATLVSQQASCTTAMSHYLGGEFLSRARRGDPDAPAPLTPVSRAQERRAFDLLDRYVFSPNAWTYSPQTLRRLVYTEYEPLLDFTYPPIPRHDISLGSLAAIYQNRALEYMFSPTVLARIADLPSKAAPNSTISLADVFSWTQNSVYGDIFARQPIKGEVRRNLQRRYTRLLVELAMNPQSETPYDAQALARHELTDLARRLHDELTRNQADLQTRAHLEAMNVDVDRALNATQTINL
ncbi:MAG TPA: zinc-dependent metalloprotease [Candidatus Baltobacteraceae bacterium]|jgi:hypothetical protein|nr:zinc-dependent metalloprotease [Candidatus Baltobacteraceae bacterium]